MNVVISPNLKRERIFINARAEQVKPFTREVIAPVEQPYVPDPVDVAKVTGQPMSDILPEPPKADPLGDRIQRMIDEKVNKIVEQKVEEALRKLL